MNKLDFPASVRRNWGRRDAEADIEHNRRNRALNTQHDWMPLPTWDKPYRDGYNQAWHEYYRYS